jgi:nitric oxide dioxygenase
MSPEQTAAFQRSFAQARRIGPIFAATFYRELFAVAPGLHVLFGSDPIEQGQHLMGALSRIVDGIHAPESVLPFARALALRHVCYGVEAQHYIAFVTALMRTLRHELADEFTPSVREAWAAAIKLLSETMMEAAYGANASEAKTASRRVG